METLRGSGRPGQSCSGELCRLSPEAQRCPRHWTQASKCCPQKACGLQGLLRPLAESPQARPLGSVRPCLSGVSVACEALSPVPGPQHPQRVLVDIFFRTRVPPRASVPEARPWQLCSG